MKYPIYRIREVSGTDKKGTSALGLIKAAEQLGFSAKGVKANKAESNGKLDIKAELQTGIMIQTGTIVASILPSANEYKFELVISDKDIANIEEGQEIKYNFKGLPHNEYGFSKGNIENISVDSKVDSESGIVFYKGEGSLKENILYSNEGEKSELKAGMTCEARVVTRKQRMLYYFLEKLNLKKI